MTDKLLMAIGLNYLDKSKGVQQGPSISSLVRKLSRSLDVNELDGEKATIIFNDYENAEDLIKDLYERCSQDSEYPDLNFYIVLLRYDVKSQNVACKRRNITC